jgi:hypothetical protein
MQEISLGTLRPIDPRTMWPHEASNFTPWLAQPNNIKRLGDAIGLELEIEHTEVAVGPFAADILARETASGTYVVIENQLNRTDHDHLGKSLIYAAAFGILLLLSTLKTATRLFFRQCS